MAARSYLKEEAAVSSNVVRLPTAAPCKVDNSRWREQRRAALAARECNRWGAPTVEAVRRKREDGERFGQLERSPELLLVLAILNGMDRDARINILSFVSAAKMRSPDCMATDRALDIARSVAPHPATEA